MIPRTYIVTIKIKQIKNTEEMVTILTSQESKSKQTLLDELEKAKELIMKI